MSDNWINFFLIPIEDTVDIGGVTLQSGPHKNCAVSTVTLGLYKNLIIVP